MLGIWIGTGIVSLLTLGAGALVYTKKGRTYRARMGRWLKRKRRTRISTAIKDTKTAVKHHRTVKAQTPRGKLKAKRRAQAPRIIAGRVRTDDDPTRTRRAVRWTGTKAKNGTRTVANRTRTAWANRKVKRAGSGPKVLMAGPKLFPGEGTGTAERSLLDFDREHVNGMRRSGLCGATRKDGQKCTHRVRNGKCAAGHSSGTAA